MLRPMTLEDLDLVVPLQREGAVAALSDIFPQHLHPFPDAAVRRRWTHELADPSVSCFVVVDDDHLVAGFAAVRGPELLHFGTAVHTWGSGLAGSAHDEVIERIGSRGHGHAGLWVFRDNARARRFYESRGWAPSGESRRSAFAPYAMLLRYEVAVPAPGPT